jgi:hypothetical protein
MVVGGGYYSYSLQNKTALALVPAGSSAGSLSSHWIVSHNCNQNGRMGGHAAKQESTMELAGENFVFVAKIPPWNPSSCDPLWCSVRQNSRSRQQYWCHGIFPAEQDQWKMETSADTTGLESKQCARISAVMSQIDRLVKKWEDQCDETTTTTNYCDYRNCPEYSSRLG